MFCIRFCRFVCKNTKYNGKYRGKRPVSINKREGDFSINGNANEDSFSTNTRYIRNKGWLIFGLS